MKARQRYGDARLRLEVEFISVTTIGFTLFTLILALGFGRHQPRLVPRRKTKARTRTKATARAMGAVRSMRSYMLVVCAICAFAPAAVFSTEIGCCGGGGAASGDAAMGDADGGEAF